jgi:hypothetical protein
MFSQLVGALSDTFPNVLTAGVAGGVEAGVEEAPPMLFLDITEISWRRDTAGKSKS